jgi:hypothetical protein
VSVVDGVAAESVVGNPVTDSLLLPMAALARLSMLVRKRPDRGWINDTATELHFARGRLERPTP